MADDRIITALDVHSLDDMKALVETLGDSISFYKVGMELFYSVGPEAVSYLTEQGKHVFLDLKLHDIPNTVGQSLRALTRLGADLMTIHGTGGRAMMAAAAEAVADEAAKLNIARPKLLAVTILTSIDEAAWQEVGGKYTIADTVKRLAALAKEAGMKPRKSASSTARTSSSSRRASVRPLLSPTTRSVLRRRLRRCMMGRLIWSSAGLSPRPMIRVTLSN